MSIWTEIALDIDDLIDENSTSITIRRGSGTLAAQTVRLESAGTTNREQRSGGAAQMVGAIVVLGESDLDIQVGDRFNDANGELYEVMFVEPNRLACVLAQAALVE
ncbi:MAG: hypothetical protein JXA14_22895 [Anaerolineae bacterium]|nr:hypothetical protein [Anaerolineae bacterium]